MAIIGIDIGTTGAKSTIFDERGNVKSFAYQEYNLTTNNLDNYEIDPNIIKNTVKKIVLESVKKYDNDDILAICATSFGESIVLLDSKDEVLCNSMIYMDKRGVEECSEIELHFSRDKISITTGLLPHPMYTAPKILWLKENRPTIFKKTKKIFFIANYILYLLGGEHVTDYSLASRSMAFDVINKKWWSDMLEYIGIDEEFFPKPVPTGSIVGTILPDVAKEYGLRKGVKLVIGGHDQIISAIGSGILNEGMTANVIGTVDCIIPVFSLDQIKTSLTKYNFPCVPYLKDKSYITYAFNITGGSILKWFRDNFAIDLSISAKKGGLNVYNLLDKLATVHPTNILVLPHFAGSGTPYMDVASKGAIVGLNFNVNRNQLYRAFLEGETYEMKVNIDCLEDSGIIINELRTVGGGAKSDLWMQIRADILGKKVVSLNIEEAGTVGSAILAGTAIGIYSSIKEAENELVKEKKIYYPNPNNNDIYQANYERYKKLYLNLKDVVS